MSDDQQTRLAEISLIASAPEGHGWLRQAEWQRLLDAQQRRAEAAEKRERAKDEALKRRDDLLVRARSEIRTLLIEHQDVAEDEELLDDIQIEWRDNPCDALAQQPADQTAQGERPSEDDTQAAVCAVEQALSEGLIRGDDMVTHRLVDIIAAQRQEAAHAMRERAAQVVEDEMDGAQGGSVFRLQSAARAIRNLRGDQ